jgi:iron(III) transport system substrate-binding protein
MPARNRHWVLAALAVAAVLIAVQFGPHFLGPESTPLVVYCAHDEEFAAGVLRDFERDTGIPVVVKYDSEATKSLGLVNLLAEEKEHPQCDVFWNNELLGTVELKDQGLLVPYRGSGFERIPERFKDPEGYWAGFAARLRVFIVNPKRFAASEAAIEAHLEDSDDLTRVAIAQPLFGTTLTHYTLLWHVWGADKLKEWHADVRRRGIQEVKGNANTKNAVVEGACDIGFTDSDDFFVAKDAGHPVEMVPIRVGSDTICIPNSVGIVRGTKQLPKAQKLIDYLLSAGTELRLAKSKSRQIPLGPVSDAELPEEVHPLVSWGAEGADLRPLLPDRRAVIEWLKSESLR